MGVRLSGQPFAATVIAAGARALGQILLTDGTLAAPALAFASAAGSGVWRDSTGVRVSHRAALVARDGPSNVYVPRVAGDFAALGLPVPDYLWLCQETSGELIPAIGAIAGVGAGTRLYRQTLAGWTRKFLGPTVGTNDYFGCTAPAIAAGESYAMIQLIAVKRPPSIRYLQFYQDLQQQLIESTGKLDVYYSGYFGTTGFYGDVSAPTTVFPHVVYRDCALGTMGFLTDGEGVQGTYNAAIAGSGNWRMVGAGDAPAPELRVCWVALYRGANAERNWKTYLQTLEWPLSW